MTSRVLSFGCAFHEFDFFRRQAVESVNRLVYLALHALASFTMMSNCSGVTDMTANRG